MERQSEPFANRGGGERDRHWRLIDDPNWSGDLPAADGAVAFPYQTWTGMAKKSNNPALYEKMRLPGGMIVTTNGGAPRTELPPRIGSVEQSSNWLSPGRTVRLPIGYVLLGAAAIFAVLIVTYVIAFKRGEF